MRPKDKVTTPYGEGILVQREANDSWLKKRWLVRIIALPVTSPLYKLHKKQRGLAIGTHEMKKIPCTNSARIEDLFNFAKPKHEAQ